MSEVSRRVDGRDGAPVWIAGSRQARPNLPSAGCPFCAGGLEAPEPYDVRWFANRWPAMPGDRCEVILYTSDHDASFASLGVAGARRVIDMWAQRTASLGARDDVAYVLVFENRGAEVGATIAHPHGQLYAFAEVPPVAARELSASAGAGGCAVCAQAAGAPAAGRAVCEAGGWSAVVPHAARYPYELLVAPSSHLPDLPSLDGEARAGVASVLVDALGRLDRLFDAPMPYMLWVHQRPTDGRDWPAAHVHIEIAPLWRAAGVPRFVAAGELGSGVFFNPVAPEDAAAALRAV